MPASFASQSRLIPNPHPTATTTTLPFFFLNYLVIAWLLSDQNESEKREREKEGGKRYITTLRFRAGGLSAPHKDLDLWPLWASVHDSWATGAPHPIYLFVVWVGAWLVCAHVEVHLLCFKLSVHLMFVCVDGAARFSCAMCGCGAWHGHDLTNECAEIIINNLSACSKGADVNIVICGYYNIVWLCLCACEHNLAVYIYIYIYVCNVCQIRQCLVMILACTNSVLDSDYASECEVVTGSS